MRIFPFAVFAFLAMTSPVRAQLQERSPGLQVVEPDEQDRDLRMTPVVRAVRKAADSVVSIYVNHATNPRGPVTEGQGSGVILDATGFVITNWHVIALAQNDATYSLEVKLKDGRSRRARLLSSSASHDLALLLMQLENNETVTPVAIGRSEDLMIGETVIAIGNPQGHANTVTSGVLSATGRSIRVQAPTGELREYTGLLQTDAAINQGNSGGALLDITGRLIGINNAMAVGAENIGFAIPVDTMRTVFENELLASDSYAASADAAWLGMDVADQKGRLVVASVVDGSPAATAGIEIGDELIEVAGKSTTSRLEYARTVLTSPADRPLPLRLRRGSKEVEATARPLTRTAGRILAMTGLDLEEVRADDDRDLVERATRTFYRDKGVFRVPLFPAVLRVRQVQAESPAAALRVQPGDLVLSSLLPTRLGREREVPLDSARDFAGLLLQLQGRTLKVVVLRGAEDLIGTLDVRKVD